MDGLLDGRVVQDSCAVRLVQVEQLAALDAGCGRASSGLPAGSTVTGSARMTRTESGGIGNGAVVVRRTGSTGLRGRASVAASPGLDEGESEQDDIARTSPTRTAHRSNASIPFTGLRVRKNCATTYAAAAR